MTKYPSLYAALEVADRDGQRGSVVRCSATLQELGFVFWACVGSCVTWHWRRPDGQHGFTTTERNAVQALRDRHKLTMHAGPDDTTTKRSTTKRSTPRIGTCTDSPACARRGCADCERAYPQQHDARPTTTTTPPPARPVARIDWNTTAPTVDLMSAMRAAFDRKK